MDGITWTIDLHCRLGSWIYNTKQKWKMHIPEALLRGTCTMQVDVPQMLCPL